MVYHESNTPKWILKEIVDTLGKDSTSKVVKQIAYVDSPYTDYRDVLDALKSLEEMRIHEEVLATGDYDSDGYLC